ncbi:MAG: trypsin-like serine protease [Chloroflexia bacterium]|nr:trypsin-like serine protease [Chloroflexia bacterium]
MKNVLSLIGAGLIGGLIVVGAMQLTKKNVNISPKEGFAKFTNDPSVSSGAIDLSVAATVASPTVVYIQAEESKEAAQKRAQEAYQNDPFAQFFGGAFSFRQPQKKGTGSGAIISKDGYIVTNNHVVDFADNVSVTLSDKRKFMAKVVGTDPRADLAVLKIDAPNLPAIQKGNSDNLKIGEWVLAIGFPYDIGTTVTAGIISATHKKISEMRGSVGDFIQTDAVVNPGNSGGALVDAQGKLVGINTAIQTRTGSYEGYSFAIPVNMMSEIADDIIKNGGRKVQSVAPQSGKRPLLGIEMVNDRFFEEATKELNLDISEGVIVADVRDGSAAQYAGILPNDVIVKIDNQDIRSTQEIRELISTYKVGDVVK